MSSMHESDKESRQNSVNSCGSDFREQDTMAPSRPSNLSPFAEPFKPRDLPLVTPEEELPCDSPSPTDALPLAESLEQTGTQTLTPVDQTQVCNVLYPSSWFQEAPSLRGSRLEKVLAGQNQFSKVAAYAEEEYPIMVSSASHSTSPGTGLRPIGFEKKIKSRLSSQSSVSSISSVCTSDSGEGESDSVLDGQFLNFIPPFLSSSKSSGSISPCESPLSENNSVDFFGENETACDQETDDQDSCYRCLQTVRSVGRQCSVNSLSDMDNQIPDVHLMTDAFNFTPDIWRYLTVSQQQLDESDSLRTSSTSSEIFTEEVEQEISTDDEDTTLLADSITDINNVSLIDGEYLACKLSARNETRDVSTPVVFGQESEKKVSDKLRRDGDVFSTSDSGFGSVSEPIGTPVTSSDSDESERCQEETPKIRQRECSRHQGQPLSMFCKGCWTVLCRVCRLDQNLNCWHLDVQHVSVAYRDLRSDLLKVQASIGSNIEEMQSEIKILGLQDQVLDRLKDEAEESANLATRKRVEELRAKREKLLKNIEQEYLSTKQDYKYRTEKMGTYITLCRQVYQLLEGLRFQDSGWNLLFAYDSKFRNILDTASNSASSALKSLEPIKNPHQLRFVNAGQQIATNVTSDTRHSGEVEIEDLIMDMLSSASPTNYDEEESSNVEEESWPACCGMPEKSQFEKPAQKQGNSETVEEFLLREIKDYLQKLCFSTDLRRASSLTFYDEMMQHFSRRQSMEDVLDDVFPQNSAVDGGKPSMVFKKLPVSEVSEYFLRERLASSLLVDKVKPFITDLHLTETGRLVLLDAANQSLKSVDLGCPSVSPLQFQVDKPLSLCSAGWDRVMVSCAGRILQVLHVGYRQIKAVITRPTAQQYRGLVRATEALVAAACPDTHSVDLLDLGGRVMRCIKPVEFVRGPEVVGVTPLGELLVVHQPAIPPTMLIGFDMAGTVNWRHAMPTRARHVSCSKVVGGADGWVYYALQGDSAIFKLYPDTGEVRLVLNSRRGLQFPSSMAVLANGQVLVTRNELPSAPSKDTPRTDPVLPHTTEIDSFGKKS